MSDLICFPFDNLKEAQIISTALKLILVDFVNVGLSWPDIAACVVCYEYKNCMQPVECGV